MEKCEDYEIVGDVNTNSDAETPEDIEAGEVDASQEIKDEPRPDEGDFSGLKIEEMVSAEEQGRGDAGKDERIVLGKIADFVEEGGNGRDQGQAEEQLFVNAGADAEDRFAGDGVY